MKNPQSLAIEMNKLFPNDRLKTIGDYACCAFCLLWYLDIDCSDIEAILTVADMIENKSIDKDCTVKWFPAVKDLTGRELEKVDFIKINLLRGVKKAIVKMSFNGKSHWVGVKDGVIVFNPLAKSVCVDRGRPTEMRVLKIKGVENEN